MGNDIDDAVGLAMIHALESRGEARLLAVTVTKDNRWAAPFIDAMNTFYGRGEIPIGVVRNGKTPDDSKMIRLPAERQRPDGSFVYPHDLVDGREAPEAVGLLRRILAKEKDGAVTIAQVGFSTNLARLLDSRPDEVSPLRGRDLVKRKVRLLSIMGGAFPEGKPEYNIETDIPSAKKLFAEWPTPIVTSGYEVGNKILYPASSILHDYGYVPDHPLAESYRDYMKMPYDRPMWDPTAVLYAVRPAAFALSPPGVITVDDKGRTHFTADPAGKHQYLTPSAGQSTDAVRAIIDLTRRPPDRLHSDAKQHGAQAAR
jgi:inosine-uridine nucleoside N-ribohydrolase